MFSAITNAASGAMDAAADMLGGEQTKPFRDAKKSLDDMEESLSQPLEQVQRVEEQVNGGLPMDAVNSAKDSFGELTSGIAGMLSGDGKNLLPPGAGMIAGCYISSIKKKLTQLSKEIDKLIGRVTDGSSEALTKLESLKATILDVTLAFKGVGGVIKDSVSSLQGCMSDFSKMASIDSEIAGLETKLGDAIKMARSAITELTGSIASVPPTMIQLIKDLIAEVDRFKVAAPKKLVKCFAPPPCCCCCGGKAGEAQQAFEGTLETVSNAINLDVITSSLDSLKNTLELVDLSSATTALDTIESQFGEVMGPVKEAAAKLASLRGAAGGDAPPPNE